MAVLVTGSTGTIGSQVVRHLTDHDVEVSALTRSPDEADLPDGATAVAGSLTDPSALRTALRGADGVFLLSAVTPDELTATLAALSLIREAGVRDVVYLSVVSADRAWTVPRFVAKAAAERAIDELGIAATILRPGYYMQNDLRERDRLQGGVYAPAIGNRGVHMVDTGDLAEAAALSLERRLAAGSALPTESWTSPTRGRAPVSSSRACGASCSDARSATAATRWISWSSSWRRRCRR